MNADNNNDDKPLLAIETDIDDDDLLDPQEDDAHPSVSPATPAESFFLSPQLRTNTVSAYALAAQLRTSSSRGATTTVATDDFQSAFGDEGEMQMARDGSLHNNNDSLFGKDILVLSRCVIPEDEDTFQDTMSTPRNTSDSEPTSEGMNMAQVVYTNVKGIWSWGKGLPLVGYLEGITETVASKVVSIAGTSLSDIDNAVVGVVSGLDTSYLNPAISAVVDAIMKGVGKADSTFRPMIESVVPSMAKKTDKATGGAPELTTTPVAAVN